LTFAVFVPTRALTGVTFRVFARCDPKRGPLMTTDALHSLLEDLADTRELVISTEHAGNPLMAAWRHAVDEARGAYEMWSAAPSRLSYSRYLAAEDQADAALASLHAAEAVCHAPRRLAA
jgi:hypothetical protein